MLKRFCCTEYTDLGITECNSSIDFGITASVNGDYTVLFTHQGNTTTNNENFSIGSNIAFNSDIFPYGITQFQLTDPNGLFLGCFKIEKIVNISDPTIITLNTGLETEITDEPTCDPCNTCNECDPCNDSHIHINLL